MNIMKKLCFFTLIFFMFSSSIVFASEIKKNETQQIMTTPTKQKLKFQFLSKFLLEQITKYLSLDDFLNLNSIKNSKILQFKLGNLTKTFVKRKHNSNVYEYLSVDLLPKVNQTWIMKLLNIRNNFFQLPKFIDHVVVKKHLRFIAHSDGKFTIERAYISYPRENGKALCVKEFRPIELLDLVPKDFSRLELIQTKCIPENFVSTVVHQHKEISLIFKNIQIGFTHANAFDGIVSISDANQFVPENKNYYVINFKNDEGFIVLHHSSGRGFVFKGKSWEKVLLDPNQNLTLKFFKKYGFEINHVVENPDTYLMNLLDKIKSFNN